MAAASEVDDLLSGGFGGVEIVGVGARRQVLPTAVRHDEHDRSGLDLTATFAAPASAAPADRPANTPHSATSRRVHSIDSRGRTTRLRSRSSKPFQSSNT